MTSDHKFGVNSALRVHSEYFAKNMTVPQNTTEVGNGNEILVGGTLSGLEVQLWAADTEIVLAPGTQMVVVVQHRMDAADPWEDTDVIFTVNEGTYPVQERIDRLTLPMDIKRYARANVTTDDVAATGTLDLFTALIPR